MFYRGFEIQWHPDSWEFSYVPSRGADRVYLGAQFSVRAAIDRQLDGSARAVASAAHRPLASTPGDVAAEKPVRTVRTSGVARLLGGVDDRAVSVRLQDGRVVEVRQVATSLPRWHGPLPADFGLVPNKKAVDIDGVCGYPELAVVASLRAQGWDARWRKNFGGTGWWVGIGQDEALPSEPDLVVTRITRRATEIAVSRGIAYRGAGIWDVLAWRERKYLFVEVKGSEGFNDNQRLWLEAALDLAVPLGSFVVLRYTLTDP
jgi:hypothetical protein